MRYEPVAPRYFGNRSDDVGLAETWALVAALELNATQTRAIVLAVERAIEHGERAGSAAIVADAREWLYGPYRLGRDEEAWELTERAEAVGADDDIMTLMLVRQVRAKLLARRGEFKDAERLAREALTIGSGDNIGVLADAWRDLAIVLAAAGKIDVAIEALSEAHGLYEGKGHTVGVARIEELRSELVASLGA